MTSHELPDGHDIRIGPGTVQVRVDGEWTAVADHKEACEALAFDVHDAILAAASDVVVASRTRELPDGHDIRIGAGTVEVKVRGGWEVVAGHEEVCEVLLHLVQQAARAKAAPVDAEERERLAAALVHLRGRQGAEPAGGWFGRGGSDPMLEHAGREPGAAAARSRRSRRGPWPPRSSQTGCTGCSLAAARSTRSAATRSVTSATCWRSRVSAWAG